MMKSTERLSRGFTLIEILVVLFIISIVTTVALLSISRNENRQLEAFTKEFIQRVTLAEEQAMLQPSVLGLAIQGNAYQFARYQPAQGEKKSFWQPTQDSLLGNYVIPGGIELNVEVGGQKMVMEKDDSEKHSPQIVISTNGDITPFTIYVAKTGKSPRYVINGDADGNITSKLLT
jgi:general secretion pathway protein H